MADLVCPKCQRAHELGATCNGFAARPEPQEAPPLRRAAAQPEGEPAAEAAGAVPGPASVVHDGAGADPDVLTGKVLGGKYVLERRIGEGGMGEVYRAEHRELGRKVAVKRIATVLAGRTEAQKRLLLEARTAACISHPNIVQVFDVGTDDENHPFFVMELLDGETLQELVRREGPLAPDRAVDITLQILDALVVAHRTVVHRDLKPSNVVVRKHLGQDLVTILDFGIAKLRDGSLDLTQPGLAVGTPAYSPPEVASHEDIAHPERIDIYMAGLLLYVMVAGRHFLPKGALAHEIVALHAAGAPPLRKLAPGCPPALEAIACRALAVRPEDRYPSAAEFLRALRAFRHPEALAPGGGEIGGIGDRGDEELPHGTVVDGKYRVEGKLGQGGHGVVYEVTDLVVQRRCALKLMTAGVTSARARARFLREAELAAKVDHPNVVRVHGGGEWQARPYLVFELVEGTTLRERWGGLSWTDLVGIVAQVAAALDALHARGIVHRDLSPDNILVEKGSLRVRVTDFGVARPEGSELTAPSTAGGKRALGRFGYMSPEQIVMDPVTGAADQWALGAIVYEALTGWPPFHPGANAPAGDREGAERAASEIQMEMIEEVQKGEPPPAPRTRNRSVPDGVDAVILRALAPVASARFSSCAELASALDAFRGESVVPAVRDAEPGAVTEIAWSKESTAPMARGRRRLWRAGLAAAAVVLVGGTATVVGLRGRTGEALAPSVPAAVPAPATAGAPAATPTFVKIALRSSLPGVRVRLEGAEDTLELPAGISNRKGLRKAATFLKDGYEPLSRELVFDEDHAEDIVMTPLAPAAPAAPPAAAGATVEKGIPGRRTRPDKKDQKKNEKEEDLYRRPGMGDKPATGPQK